MAAHGCATGDAVGGLAWRSVLFAGCAAFRSSIAADLADLSEVVSGGVDVGDCSDAISEASICLLRAARQREGAQTFGGRSDAQLLITTSHTLKRRKARPGGLRFVYIPCICRTPVRCASSLRASASQRSRSRCCCCSERAAAGW